MKKALIVAYIIAGSFLIVSSVGASSIKVAPLKYEQKLTPGKTLVGAVDISNPSDSVQKYTASVRAFRQINEDGELQFYEDSAITQGIEVDQPAFSLGAHQVARIFFSINPDKLPKSGIYAAVLFNTNPDQPSTATRLATSVSSGTLLILDNSLDSEESGEVVNLQAKFWQFGSGLAVITTYKNTGSGDNGIAFNPQLSIKSVPWGKPLNQTGPLVFAGNQRQVNLIKPGSYFGVLPLQITDVASGESKTKWVFAITGYWTILAPILLVLLLVGAGLYYRRKLHDSAEIY